MTVSLNLSEVAAFKKELKSLLEQLRSEVGEELSEQTQVHLDPEVHDVGEDAENVVDLMISVGNISRHNSEIVECLEALERIENGDFGFCVECAEEIELSRLKACPTASRCIRCQSAYEANLKKTA